MLFQKKKGCTKWRITRHLCGNPSPNERESNNKRSSKMTSAIWYRTSREDNRRYWLTRSNHWESSVINPQHDSISSLLQELFLVPSSCPFSPSIIPSTIFCLAFVLHERCWQKHRAFFFLSSYLVTVWHGGNRTPARLYVSTGSTLSICVVRGERDRHFYQLSRNTDGMRLKRRESFFIDLNWFKVG